MMNSYLARTALLGLSLVASLATAKPFQGLDTIEAAFLAQNSTRYHSARANLSHTNDTLTLSLQPALPVCRKGELCEESPEPIEYSFENVKSTVNRCGVVTSIALIDQTPVDGVRTEVTLTDYSSSSCRGRNLQVAATLNVKHEWYNRLQGRKVRTSDVFLSDHVETLVTFQGVIRAELQSVTSQAFLGGNLYFDGRKGLIELNLNPVCRQGLACNPKNPEPESFIFEKARTEVDSCGIIRTVASFDDRPVDGIYMKVTINNNRNNTCPTFAPLAALNVVVEKAYYSRFEAEYVQTLDFLEADDFALIKPGK